MSVATNPTAEATTFPVARSILLATELDFAVRLDAEIHLDLSASVEPVEARKVTTPSTLIPNPLSVI